MSVYYYVSVSILCDTAKEIGKNDDYNNYNQLKEKIYNAILKEFFSPNGRLTINTQTGYILALYYKIYREGQKDAIIKGFLERLHLDQYKLKTGFAGTPLIGWIYSINLGATTVWERWNSLLEDGTVNGNAMNSFNHYAYGSVCEAIYSRIVGLKNLSPGWKKVLIQPHLNYRLKKINFTYDSISGRYEISWNYDEYKFYLNVSIPNGAEAKIILPDNKEYNVGQGEYKYETDINEKIIAPFSIDTPIFELKENEDVKNVLMQVSPAIYYITTMENSDYMYNTIRQLSEDPFIGLGQDVLDKCQEELAKIKVLNYTIPEEIPSDEPSDEPSDPDGRKSGADILIFRPAILSLIILLYV